MLLLSFHFSDRILCILFCHLCPPLEKAMHPTPVFLPGESQGRGSLEGCRLWGRTESDTIEVTQQQQQQHAHHNNYLGHSFTCCYFTVSLNHFCIVDFLLRDRQVFTFLLLDNCDCNIILVYIWKSFSMERTRSGI